MRWFATAACAAAMGLALASCGGRHTHYVTVPLRAQQTDVRGAYDLLHQLGLRVALTRATQVSSLNATIVRLSPRTGTRVPLGGIVKITPVGRMMGSPAVLKSHPHYSVPDFSGRPLSAAIRWADTHQVFWMIPTLPKLPASNAPQLFDAYRIVSQEPKPGGTIGQGVMVGKSFKPTPLTLTVVRR